MQDRRLCWLHQPSIRVGHADAANASAIVGGAVGRAYIFARYSRSRGASSSISASFAQSSVCAAVKSATLSRSPAMNSRPAMCRSSTATIARHSWRRSEEHTSELQSLMRISYAVFCLKKKNKKKTNTKDIHRYTNNMTSYQTTYN